MASPDQSPLPTHRAYQVPDRNACIDVFRSNIPGFFHEGEAQDFVAFLDDTASHYLVALAGDEIVGCGGFTLSEDGQLASLCWGMVRRDWHGQRIGEHLLRARLQAITGTPAAGVRLATSQHTEGFYQRYGFVVQSRRLDGIAPGLDEVEMTLDLTTPLTFKFESCP